MAVEVVTNFGELNTQNKERYKDQTISGDQVPEVLAQVGALIKAKEAGTPFANLTPRKMVMAGTSATAGILIQYLPGHMVFELPTCSASTMVSCRCRLAPQFAELMFR